MTAGIPPTKQSPTRRAATENTESAPHIQHIQHAPTGPARPVPAAGPRPLGDTKNKDRDHTSTTRLRPEIPTHKKNKRVGRPSLTMRRLQQYLWRLCRPQQTQGIRLQPGRRGVFG